MRITKQTSGGRGEYEIAEASRSGLTPVDLMGREIHLRFGSYEIKTAVRLTPQGGKRRLRRLPNTNFPQVQRQTAGILLLPKPVRDEERMEGGQPVLQNSRYIINDIEFGQVSLIANNSFWAEVRTIYYGNQAYQAEQLDVSSRIGMIEQLWRRRKEFPREIDVILQEHERLVRQGDPIPTSVETLVTKLQRETARYGHDLGIFYDENTDVVPALWEALNEIVQFEPISLDQIEPEQVELRRREIKRWQQYVSRRGGNSVRFKRAVQKAYGYKCIMCGAYFPNTDYNQNPGIDAAHILPWATYDLDMVCNGVALCKLHHWAFDEGLLRLVYNRGRYLVQIQPETEASLTAFGFSIDVLNQVVGQIPEERLPIDPRERPHPDLLNRLNSEQDLSLK